MPLNSQIALGIRPFQLEGPMDQATKALTLSGLIEQQRMRQMQAEEAKRKVQRNADYRARVIAAGSDPAKLRAAAIEFSDDPTDVLRYGIPKPEEGPFSKPDIKDFTPESVRLFMQSKNPSDLVRAPKEAAPEASPEIVKLLKMASTLPPGSPMRTAIERRIDVMNKDPSTRIVMPQAPSITEVLAPDGKTMLRIDAKVYKGGGLGSPGVIGLSGKAPTTSKPIPTPLSNKLTETAEIADATDRFATTYKDSYGGKTFTGDLSNTVGRIFGDESGQSQWWQDYELHQSQVRNKLFGSALTAPEIAAWEKSAINPRMDPKQIRLNLGRRQRLEKTGLDRMMKGIAAGGYSTEQIEAFTGRQVPSSAPSDNNDPLGIRK